MEIALDGIMPGNNWEIICVIVGSWFVVTVSSSAIDDPQLQPREA
jgi:hypothetical protein